MNRLKESTLKRPAFFEAIPHVIRVNREMLTQRRETRCHAANGKYSVRARISSLLCSGGPFAVFLEVAKRIVLPVKTVLFRSLAHVGQEALKGHPSFADGNAPSSVEMKPDVLRIGASGYHRRPSIVSWRRGVVDSMAVNKATRSGFFPSQAAARPRLAGLKVRVWKCHSSSAFTEANAGSVPVFILGAFSDNFQPSKREADERCCFGHRIGSFNFVSSGGSGDNRPRCKTLRDYERQVNP